LWLQKTMLTRLVASGTPEVMRKAKLLDTHLDILLELMTPLVCSLKPPVTEEGISLQEGLADKGARYLKHAFLCEGCLLARSWG